MYYLVIVQNNEIPAIYCYDSRDAVFAAFHAEMAYRASGRTSTKCAILDSDMCTVRSEIYTAPSVNAEPQEG